MLAPDEVGAAVRLHKLAEGRRELPAGVRRLGRLHRGRHPGRLFRQVTTAKVQRVQGLTASDGFSGEKPPLSPHPLPARYRYRRLQVEGTRPLSPRKQAWPVKGENTLALGHTLRCC